MVGGVAGGVGASVGGVMSFAREQFERRFTDVSYDLLISKTFYFFFYAAFGYTIRPPAYLNDCPVVCMAANCVRERSLLYTTASLKDSRLAFICLLIGGTRKRQYS